MPNAQRALGHSGLQPHAVTSTAAAEGTHTIMAAVA